MTVTSLLVLLAFVFTIIHATLDKIPLWIAVLLLCVALLVGTYVR